MKDSTFSAETTGAASKRAGWLLVAVATMALTACNGGSSSSGTQQQPITVSVSPAGVTMDSGQAQVFSASLANDTTGAGVAWTVSGGGALSATTTTSATFTASATSATTASVTATSKANATASTSASITVNPALSIHGPAAGTGTVGTPYSDATASASGGSGTKSFAIASGALPTGITISASSGAISGTPTTAGTFTFAVSVTDSATTPVTVAAAPVSITIAQPGVTVSIANPNRTIEGGQVVNLTATVANDPTNKGVTWTTSGGGSLSASTTSSTTFTALGTINQASETVTATSIADTTRSATASISITPGPQITTQGALPDGIAGVAYSKAIAVTGGTEPFTFSISTGSLPAGLTLNASTGTISGTPTAAVTSKPFAIVVYDSAPIPQSFGSSMTLTIDPASTVAISTTSLPQATPNSAYSATLSAAGGVSPYTWSITLGSLPTGLSLSTSTGVISGTTTSTMETSFTVQVADSQTPTPATASFQFHIIVQPALAAGANDGELTGSYAFQLAGISNGGTAGVDYGAATVGSLTFDGAGNITSGVQDLNNINNPMNNNPVTGKYTLGADNRGTILLDNGSSVVTLAIAAGGVGSGVAQTVRLIRFDDSGVDGSGIVATGVARLQTASAFTQLNGAYVFGMQGHTPCVGCASVAVTPFGPVSLVGYFTAAGGSVSGGLADGAGVNASYNNVTLSGATTAPTAKTGRGTLTLTPTGTLFPAAPTHFVYYVVNAGQLFLMSTDAHGHSSGGFYTLLSGEADAQQISTYTSSTLSGNAIGYGNAGIGGNGVNTGPTGAAAGIYRYTFNQGADTASATIDSNSGGTLSSQSFPTSAYTLSAEGRMSVSASSTAPIIYFYANGEGFGTQQPNSTQTGSAGLITFEPQMAGPFSISSLASSFILGSLPPGVYDQGTNSGVTTLAANGTIEATLDSSKNDGTLAAGQTGTGTYALDSGTGSTTGRGTIAGSSIVYIINNNRLVTIDSTATGSPNTLVFDAQTAP